MRHRFFLTILLFCLFFSRAPHLSADSNGIAFESYLARLLERNELFDPSGELSAIALLMINDPGILSNEILQLQSSWYADLDWAVENSLTNTTRIISNNILARVREYCCVPQWQPPRSGRRCHSGHTCREPAPDPVPFRNFWFAGLGGHLQQDEIHELPAFHSNDWGFLTGFDFVLSNWLSVGMAGGFTYTNLKWDDLRGHNAIQNVYIGPYFVWNCSNWVIEGSLIKGKQRYSTERQIHFAFIDRRPKSTYYGDSIVGHLGFSRNCCWQDYNLTPYLMLDYTYNHVGKIKEKGAKSFDLIVRGHDLQFFQGEVGASFSATYRTEHCVIVPTIKGGFQTISPILGNKLRTHLVNQIEAFTVKTTDQSIYQATGGMFVNIYALGLPEISFSYNGQWGNKRREYYYTAEIDWCF